MGYTIRSKNYHWSYNFQMMVPLSTRCESAFLHRDVEETEFVEQTQGYKRHGEEDKVCKLRKAL